MSSTVSEVLTYSRTRGTMRLVLLIIASHARDGGYGNYFATATSDLDDVAREANITVKKAREVVDRLKETGELKVCTGWYRHPEVKAYVVQSLARLTEAGHVDVTCNRPYSYQRCPNRSHYRKEFQLAKPQLGGRGN